MGSFDMGAIMYFDVASVFIGFVLGANLVTLIFFIVEAFRRKKDK